ncbi:hypothetical protein JCM5350_004373 [Sporobolomyces pararoseus]
MADSLQYSRTSQSRRPPFYDLKRITKSETLSIEDSELGSSSTYLATSDDGTLGSIRRWYSELQEISDWLYQPGSPSLVDLAQPNQHAVHLLQSSFDIRQVGAYAVSGSAQKLFYQLCSPTFQDDYVKPWKALSTEQQEEVLLEALATCDRRDESQSFLVSRFHKLVPEFNISDLVAEGGEGFLDLLKHLEVHLENYARLAVKPIPNEKFFGKFGIGQEELPLSRADRAFQEEYLLRRHSLLFLVVTTILRRIAGDSDEGSIHVIKLSNAVAEERCTSCRRTAKETDTKQLLYCGRCKKVDRNVAYCSASCHKKDWVEHKKDCSNNSSHRQVPIISTPQPTSVSTDLPPLRRLLKAELDKEPLQFWLYQDSVPGNFQWQGFASDDRAQESRIRKAMRALAFKALETGNRISIALLAATLYSSDPFFPSYSPKGKKMKPTPSQSKKAPHQKEQISQFRKVFDITSDVEWSAMLELGNEEIEKPENEVLKELRDLMETQALNQRNNLLDALVRPRSDDVPSVLHDLAKHLVEVGLGMRGSGPDGDRTIGDVLRLSHGQQDFGEEDEKEGGNEEGEGTEELGGCKAQ